MTMKLLAQILVFCLFSFMNMALAQDNPMENPQWLVAQTLLGLAFVVGVIFGLAWLAKKMNIMQLGQNRQFFVVASLSLSNREKAVIVQIGEHQALLGVAPGCVRQLHLFSEPVIEPQSITQSKGQKLSASSATEFSKKLNEFLTQGNKST